jgi:hypothetical protein
VEIVDIGNARSADDVGAHVVHVHALRCGLKEHIGGVAEQPPGSRQDE